MVVDVALQVLELHVQTVEELCALLGEGVEQSRVDAAARRRAPGVRPQGAVLWRLSSVAWRLARGGVPLGLPLVRRKTEGGRRKRRAVYFRPPPPASRLIEG